MEDEKFEALSEMIEDNGKVLEEILEGVKNIIVVGGSSENPSQPFRKYDDGQEPLVDPQSVEERDEDDYGPETSNLLKCPELDGRLMSRIGCKQRYGSALCKDSKTGNRLYLRCKIYKVKVWGDIGKSGAVE